MEPVSDVTRRAESLVDKSTQDFLKVAVKHVLLVFLNVFYLVTLFSCSDLNENIIFLDDSGKHPEGWAQSGHQEVVKKSTSECVECHGSDFKGGISGVSCNACHMKTVHPVPWEVHGQAAVNDLTGCGDCHGSDFKGGISGVSCSKCHAQAAHPVPWENHGQGAANDLLGCSVCHGSDFKGGVAGISCYTCHNGPYGTGHPQGWDVDHALDARNGTTSCAKSSCHGTDYRGGEGGVSCYHCHLGGPSGGKHPSGWGNPQENHEEYFESNGKNATACAQKYCHGTDLKGGSAPPNGSWSKGPSCYTCHGKEWKIP